MNEESNDVIFEYKLMDAWYRLKSKITVLNKKDNNVVCVFKEKLNNDCMCDGILDDKGFQNLNKKYTNYFTIREEVIIQIISILNKNKSFFKKKTLKIKGPSMFDGCVNSFYFSNGVKNIKVECFNISYYIEHEEEKAGDTKLLLDVLEEISGVLIESEIDKKYFNFEV